MGKIQSSWREAHRALYDDFKRNKDCGKIKKLLKISKNENCKKYFRSRDRSS